MSKYFVDWRREGHEAPMLVRVSVRAGPLLHGISTYDIANKLMPKKCTYPENVIADCPAYSIIR